MEVRPTFEREQKRSAARVQNVDHCFSVQKHFAVSVCGKTTFWADSPRARLHRFCGLSCWSDLHFQRAVGIRQRPRQIRQRSNSIPVGFLPPNSGESGGIGRRARFRIWWPKGLGGSSPPSRIWVLNRRQSPCFVAPADYHRLADGKPQLAPQHRHYSSLLVNGWR